MGKTYVRIDDRLIHGQIVVSWCGVLGIKEIIAIDDETASNKILQQIMLMGVSRSFNPAIVTNEEAKVLLDKEVEHNRLVIVRNPQNLQKIMPFIHSIEILYIGNIQKNKDSLYNISSGAGGVLFLSQDDIDIIDEIHKTGLKIIIQMVPQSSSRSWEQVKKNFKKK